MPAPASRRLAITPSGEGRPIVSPAGSCLRRTEGGPAGSSAADAAEKIVASVPGVTCMLSVHDVVLGRASPCVPMRSRNSRHLGSGSGIGFTLFVDSCACLNPAGDGGSLADEARTRPAALSAARRKRRFAMVETRRSPCGEMTKLRFCFIESEPVPSNVSSAKTKRDVIPVSRHPRCLSSVLDRRTATAPLGSTDWSEMWSQFSWCRDGQCTIRALAPQQCLYLRPLPHGHCSLRPILGPSRRNCMCRGACWSDRRSGSK
jgi:hypothetical protein